MDKDLPIWGLYSCQSVDDVKTGPFVIVDQLKKAATIIEGSQNNNSILYENSYPLLFHYSDSCM